MRPKKHRHIRFDPLATYFKPIGIPMKQLGSIEVLPDELEALRLRYDLGCDQLKGAEEMKISQSTFQRILASANRKIAKALIGGMAIKLIKRNPVDREQAGAKGKRQFTNAKRLCNPTAIKP